MFWEKLLLIVLIMTKLDKRMIYVNENFKYIIERKIKYY